MASSLPKIPALSEFAGEGLRTTAGRTVTMRGCEFFVDGKSAVEIHLAEELLGRHSWDIQVEDVTVVAKDMGSDYGTMQQVCVSVTAVIGETRVSATARRTVLDTRGEDFGDYEAEDDGVEYDPKKSEEAKLLAETLEEYVGVMTGWSLTYRAGLVRRLPQE